MFFGVSSSFLALPCMHLYLSDEDFRYTKRRHIPKQHTKILKQDCMVVLQT